MSTKVSKRYVVNRVIAAGLRTYLAKYETEVEELAAREALAKSGSYDPAMCKSAGCSGSTHKCMAKDDEGMDGGSMEMAEGDATKVGGRAPVPTSVAARAWKPGTVVGTQPPRLPRRSLATSNLNMGPTRPWEKAEAVAHPRPTDPHGAPSDTDLGEMGTTDYTRATDGCAVEHGTAMCPHGHLAWDGHMAGKRTTTSFAGPATGLPAPMAPARKSEDLDKGAMDMVLGRQPFKPQGTMAPPASPGMTPPGASLKSIHAKLKSPPPPPAAAMAVRKADGVPSAPRAPGAKMGKDEEDMAKKVPSPTDPIGTSKPAGLPQMHINDKPVIGRVKQLSQRAAAKKPAPIVGGPQNPNVDPTGKPLNPQSLKDRS